MGEAPLLDFLRTNATSFICNKLSFYRLYGLNPSIGLDSLLRGSLSFMDTLYLTQPYTTLTLLDFEIKGFFTNLDSLVRSYRPCDESAGERDFCWSLRFTLPIFWANG